jgi:hypothetical protein
VYSFTPPHVVDDDSQVDGFIDEYELATRKLIHQAGPIQRLISHFDIKIIHKSSAIGLGTLGAKAHLELVVEAAFKQIVYDRGYAGAGRLDLAELDLVRPKALAR